MTAFFLIIDPFSMAVRMGYSYPDFDYGLIGRSGAGGNTKVFNSKAGPITLGSLEGRGFLVVDPSDPLGRAEGHARLSSGHNLVSRNLHAKEADDTPLRWPYVGPRYAANGDREEVETEVYVHGYTFSGDEVWLQLIQAPPLGRGDDTAP